jgi:hypothetical protein
MKRLVIVLTSLALFTCPTQGGEISDPKKPWTILCLFDGETSDLERICEYNINQLEEIESAYARILAIFDRPYKKSRDSSVRIYDIKPDDDRTEIKSHSISMGERDMGTPEVLDEILSKYLGKKNILIFKGHGYGIIPGFSKIGYNSPQDPQAIKGVLSEKLDKPLEVIIFDSCNMASVEVAYEFKNLVSVFVGSQDLMFYSMDATEKNSRSSRPGIDYIGLVSKLKPYSNPITIGKDVVNDFIEIVNQKDAIYDRSTISAIDLNVLDVSLFKRHADHLIKGLETPQTRQKYLSALQNVLESAIYFNPLGRHGVMTYYDVGNFFSLLELELHQKFELPKMGIIQSYSNTYVRTASGLSILFFKSLSNIRFLKKEDLLEKYSHSKFAKKTGWDRLIKTYHHYLELKF